MRIGEPARRHGVSDDDITHAVRIPLRWIVMDDDLTMVIGPAADGALLEIGVLDIDDEDAVVIPRCRCGGSSTDSSPKGGE